MGDGLHSLRVDDASQALDGMKPAEQKIDLGTCQVGEIRCQQQRLDHGEVLVDLDTELGAQIRIDSTVHVVPSGGPLMRSANHPAKASRSPPASVGEAGPDGLGRTASAPRRRQAPAASDPGQVSQEMATTIEEVAREIAEINDLAW